jgi:hypothetical protein
MSLIVLMIRDMNLSSIPSSLSIFVLSTNLSKNTKAWLFRKYMDTRKLLKPKLTLARQLAMQATTIVTMITDTLVALRNPS